jgi:hypothetical protein
MPTDTATRARVAAGRGSSASPPGQLTSPAEALAWSLAAAPADWASNFSREIWAGYSGQLTQP